MSYNLFLDDIREVSNAVLTFQRKPSPLHQGLFLVTPLAANSSIPESDWEIARNYYEFVWFLTNKGMPMNVSFDFDLSPEMTRHYFSYARTHGKIDYESLETKGGLHCAQFLVDFYQNNKDTIKPRVFIHSANIYGAQDMKNLLEKHFEVI